MNEMRDLTEEEFSEIEPVLKIMGITNTKQISRFVDKKLNKTYDVYLLEAETKVILKKCGKGRDIIKYDKYFADKNFNVPKILNLLETENKKYVLMEYIGDTDARECRKEQGSVIGSELAKIQSYYLTCGGYTEKANEYFKKHVFECKEKAKKYVPEVEKIFPYVENRFFSVPHTLIHDDLLPINVFLKENKAYFIDWEFAEILPYFLDLARFTFVYNEKNEMFIPKESAEEFLNSYYDKMSENSEFDISRKQFYADTAVSAFCQYVLFCSYIENEEAFKNSLDGKYLKEIIDYIKKIM